VTPTIKEVARQAGVSIATVSRVYNNTSLVDEKTRQRVRKVAHELQYVPSALGRNLSTKKTNAIGLLLPDLFGEFFSEVIRGCDETAQKQHFHLIVSSSHTTREDLAAALKIMRGRVDGLIILSPHVESFVLDANLPHNFPVVLLNAHPAGDTYQSLAIDNYGGAVQVVRHLLEHGHTSLAIIKGGDDNIDAAERLRGFRDAVAGHPGKYDVMEVSGDFSDQSGYNAAQILLRRSPRPTAIFATNDMMAIGAMSALREAGVSIPHETALVGFDDIPIARYLTPSLTTVKFGINDLGVRAVELVCDAIRDKHHHSKQQLLLPTSLSIRDSCGCSRAAR
jgi:LacI family transcriptional regulator